MNSIVLAQKYQPLLDEVFKAESKTTDLESTKVKFDGANTVKIMKMTVPSLGKYDRNSGFKRGGVSVDWEPWKLEQDRGREFVVDAVDDEETLNMTFGAASSEFIRTCVAPQIDAYRFAKLASTSGVSYAEDKSFTTGEEVLAALSAGMTKMDEDEVPSEGRILYITPTLKRLVDAVDNYKSKKVWDDFAKVVTVPKNRFYTASKYNETTEEIEKAEGAKDINFMIVVPSAQQSVAKHVQLRIFLANGDEGTGANKNQDADAHKLQYRIVHDTNVYENKRAGIYVSAAPVATAQPTASEE